MPVCTVDGCEAQSTARGLCKRHYFRWRKYGTTDGGSQNHGTLAERLWRRVERRGDDDCWEWQGNRLPSGYGVIGRGGRGNGSILTHRAAYEVACEPIPDGMIVLHSCDNPPCCNPKHLSIGTYADNSQDMLAKKRNAYVAHRGSENGYARINPDIVRYIRTQSHRPRTDVAKELGISPCTVRDVLFGRSWSHVT